MWLCYVYLLALSAAQQADFYGAQWHRGDVSAQLRPAGKDGAYYEQVPPPTCDGLWIRPLNRTNDSPKHRCTCNETHISCINLQMTPPPPGETPKDDSQYFMEIDDEKFANIQRITIHGNNLERLPKVLFGPGSAYKNLKHLNLSSNYFVAVEPGAFQQELPKLEVLDLSDNELVLKDANHDMFSYLPKVKNLNMKNSFNSYEADSTVKHLDAIFRKAAFKGLKTLTLDSNSLHEVPENLGCYFKELTFLSLRRNSINKWNLISNATCLSKLIHLDLSQQSRAIVADEAFIHLLDSLPKKAVVFLNGNQFTFTNDSLPLFEWLNTTARAVSFHRAVVAWPKRRTMRFEIVQGLSRSQLLHLMNNPPKTAPTLSPSALFLMLLCMRCICDYL